MSAFSNPFAQVGSYQNDSAVSDELVTTAYLTGLPDVRQFQDQHVALMFRTLLKRDTRTKQRALGELEQWLDSLSSEEGVEDSIHLAYVQMYAKLSIDVAPLIRVQSHVVLAKLYSALGKRSSKYLKYSVGPWVAATNDPDPRAAIAAKDAMVRVFPGDKQAVLLDKMKDHVLNFVYDSCANASAQSLSDERYVSKEDASQKYTRLVKCCVDVLAHVPNMFDLQREDMQSLVSSGRLWKFYSSSDSSLARSTLQLTATHVHDLEPYAGVVWHELLRAGRKNSGGSGVAIEVVQLMNVFTKKYPSITWPDESDKRKDAMISIAQFVSADPPHPSKFWPLLYNLVLMVPGHTSKDLTPLFKPLEKVVLRLRNDAELERSAWGCFISLAGKMGPEFVHRAFKAAEHRCKLKSVPTDILAMFLARLAKVEGVDSLVRSQLEDSKVPFAYCRVIAQMHIFRPEIETIVVGRVEPEQLSLLVEADPDLTLPENQDVGSSPLWVKIAAISNTVDSQSIIESAVEAGHILPVLENAVTLANKGVRVTLDNRIPLDSGDVALPILRAAVGAHDTFVTRETSIRVFKLLVQHALEVDDNARDMFRVIRENQDFINSVISSDPDLKHDLETLRPEDRMGVLRHLSAMTIQEEQHEHAGPETAALQTLKSIALESIDLSVPLQRISVLRAPMPLCEKPFSQGLSECERLVNSVALALEASHIEATEIVKLCVLRSFAQHWFMLCLKGKSATFSAFLQSVDAYLDEEVSDKSEIWGRLWDLTEVNNYQVAYHAAVALTWAIWKEQASEDLYSRNYFAKPSLRGAIIAFHHAAKTSQEYENVQRSLVRRALTHDLGKSEWMLIDREFIPENSALSLKGEVLKDPELTCIILETVKNVDNREELAFESQNAIVQFSALSGLDSDTSLTSVLDVAAGLPVERTNFDKEKGWILLQLLNEILTADSSAVNSIDDWESIQKLLVRRDSDFLPWMALLVARVVEHPELSLHLEQQPQGAATPADVVGWLTYLNYLPVGKVTASHEAHLRILEFVARGLRQGAELGGYAQLHEPKAPPSFDFDEHDSDGNLLYQMCMQHGSDVREWHRNLRDKQTQKLVDTALATYIVPELITSIKNEIESNPRNDDIEVSVNRKQREIRASREVEDEFTVEVIISLPEQYPGKPATIEIRNLAGVHEAKKRGWLLEARQNVQNEGVLKALEGILTRLNNFLEGVEPCAICYATVNDANKLPNKECSQCHNIYHTECLYKWFSTNNDRLCPMCRSPM